jgi:hypothetical protein
MIRLATVIETFGTDFIQRLGGQALPSWQRAMAAMKACRNHLSRQMLAQCDECDHQVLVPHSCGHRSCPHCQAHGSQQWLQRQLQRQVSAGYFLVTFTLPRELRPLAFGHQRQVYGLMLKLAWETLRTFAKNDRQLGGMAGAIGVLHTHSRRLDYHPHVHCVVPAATVDTQTQQWREKAGYLFNHKALAKVYRAKLLAAIKDAGLTLPAYYPKTWVVDCTAVGSGESALVYLGRYLYKGVIQEKDILSCHDGQVAFQYEEAKTKQTQTRTLPGGEFLRLVLQHVLPKGFRRARNYGFLHPNSKRLWAIIQAQVLKTSKATVNWIKTRPQWLCRCCGGAMKILATRLALGAIQGLPVPDG